MKLAIGDEVRVHYHPANPKRSFVEGVVSRIDVPTLRGRVFVVEVTCEVVFDREQPIRPGFQNYVLYECRDEFPGRIEVLARLHTAGEDAEPAPEQEAEPEIQQAEIEEEVATPSKPVGQPEAVPAPVTESDLVAENGPGEEPEAEAEPEKETFTVEVDRRTPQKNSRFIAALFRKAK